VGVERDIDVAGTVIFSQMLTSRFRGAVLLPAAASLVSSSWRAHVQVCLCNVYTYTCVYIDIDICKSVHTRVHTRVHIHASAHIHFCCLACA